MGIKLFLRAISKLFGSVLLAFGILLVLLFFISGSVISNLDNISGTIKSVSVRFLEENKAEIRSELAKVYQGQEFITKDQAKLACRNPSIIGEDYRNLISSDFCSRLDSMQEEEVRNYIMDYLIDSSVNKLIESFSSEEALDQIKETVNSGGGQKVKSFGLIIGILAYLLGVFLILVGCGFDLVYGLYSVTARTTINLASTGLIMLLVRFVPVNSVLAFIEWLKGILAIEIQELPPILLKLVITIALEWIRLFLNPILIGLLVALVPLIGLSIFLHIKRKKLLGEAKKEELEKVSKK